MKNYRKYNPEFYNCLLLLLNVLVKRGGGPYLSTAGLVQPAELTGQQVSWAPWDTLAVAQGWTPHDASSGEPPEWLRRARARPSNAGEVRNRLRSTVSRDFSCVRTSGGARVAWCQQLDAEVAGATTTTTAGDEALGCESGTRLRWAFARAYGLIRASAKRGVDLTQWRGLRWSKMAATANSGGRQNTARWQANYGNVHGARRGMEGGRS